MQIQFKLQIVVVTSEQITQQELGQVIGLARSRAHVMLEEGIPKPMRPPVVKPGVEVLIIEFAPPTDQTEPTKVVTPIGTVSGVRGRDH